MKSHLESIKGVIKRWTQHSMSVYLGDNIKGMLEVMNLRFISDNDSPFHGQPSLYLFITSIS